MTIDQLLDFWAEWSARKDDGGLGYGTSRLAVLISDGIVSGSGNSSLPYGIDENAVALAVERYLSRQPNPAREIIRAEYCCCGSQADKAKMVSQRLGLVVSAQNYRVTLHRAVKKMAGNPEIEFLLKKMS